jgi:DNA (cytosine-5)-methyltransferase 1
MTMQRRIISLYTGAGGLDLGFEAAGFEVACAVEMDDEAVQTLRSNRDWAVIHRDIHDVPSREILAEGSLDVGEADVLIGGPPCQPFSKSGYWANGDTMRLDDPRAGTMAAYLRVLRDTLPKTFFLENVPGLAYRGKSEGPRADRADHPAHQPSVRRRLSVQRQTAQCRSLRRPADA